jgi:hypothetical protein
MREVESMALMKGTRGPKCLARPFHKLQPALQPKQRGISHPSVETLKIFEVDFFRSP